MEWGLLGPLVVRAAGQPVVVGSPKCRALLAVLLLEPGRFVPVGTLAEAIWGDEQPGNPRRAVQLCVTRLRAILREPELIVTGTDGYRINAVPESVDLGRFQADLREADEAARRSDLDGQGAALHRALGRWRGEPLADVRSELLHREYVPRLWEQRLHAVEQRIEVDLRLGRHLGLVDELTELTARHPLRERLWLYLVSVLYRGGRRAEALDAYHRGRRHLADELGVDPGEDLQRLYAQVLAGTPERDTGAVTLPPVPRQLPPRAPGLVGRTAELARLDGVLPNGGLGSGIVIVNGTAGVGKTALALHWARRVAECFPDGQLWVDLRGYDRRAAVTAQQALTLMLGALGVRDTDLPSDLDGQIGLYRSLMDGRRMLIVLDNAAATPQVRPLLPGGTGSVVLITSRRELTSLIAMEGAQAVRLDPLTVTESRQLFESRLGQRRTGAEPGAVDAIIDRCGRLPLALSIVAARAVSHPAVPLGALDRQLAHTGRLDALSSPDSAVDVRAVLSWSSRTLSPAAARLFRHLGLHPTAEFSTAAAASLTGLTETALRPLLDEAVGAHLVAQRSADRYTVHDLLHAYAAELAGADSPDIRREATRRALDHYLHTAHRAALLLDPHRDAIVLSPPASGTRGTDLRDFDEARRWFIAEHPTILALVTVAADEGFDDHVWQLVWTMLDFWDRRAGLWPAWLAAAGQALSAAARLDDLRVQAHCQRSMGQVESRLGRTEAASRSFVRALKAYRALNDLGGQAHVHRNHAWMLAQHGRYREAVAELEQALPLFEAIGDRSRQARTLNSIGWYHAHLGHYEKSVRYCLRAMEHYQQIHDPYGEADTWDSLGYAYHHIAHRSEAAACYRRARALYRELGDRASEVATLTRLGEVHRATGNTEAARQVWRQALRILDLSDERTVAVPLRV